MSIPHYGTDMTKLPKGMYVGLFHGRNTPTEEMNDWGFAGPVIGPLKWFHTTYGDHMRGEFDAGYTAHVKQYLDAGIITHVEEFELITTHDGTLVIIQESGKDPAFYGDWTVFYNAEGCELFDEALLKYGGPPSVVKSPDGYTFYRQPDGSYVDTPDGVNRDMKYDSWIDLLEAWEGEVIVVK